MTLKEAWLPRGPGQLSLTGQARSPRPKLTEGNRAGPTCGRRACQCRSALLWPQLAQRPQASEGLTTVSGLAPGAASPGPAAPSGPRPLLAPTLPLQSSTDSGSLTRWQGLGKDMQSSQKAQTEHVFFEATV